MLSYLRRSDLDEPFGRDETEGERGRREQGCYEPRNIPPNTPNNEQMSAHICYMKQPKVQQEFKMDLGEFFTGGYYKAAELEKPELLTITKCEIEELGEDKERKPVLRFSETDVGLVLNKTNAEILYGIFGTLETEEMAGKQVVLYAIDGVRNPRTNQMGKALRLRAPKKSQEAQHAGDIPF